MRGCLELIKNQMQRVVVQTIDKVHIVHDWEKRMGLEKNDTNESDPVDEWTRFFK